eukprot:TRINITY_DN444_c0_g4_i1.p1 TRINITY_DN444_c0_g4~~TRINITY_DN444_c0_g4_i1.p1  ORF type:complete len:746 (-),score=199.63 TRINITY_DN444_c0_g4_i1:74-2311(-)
MGCGASKNKPQPGEHPSALFQFTVYIDDGQSQQRFVHAAPADTPLTLAALVFALQEQYSTFLLELGEGPQLNPGDDPYAIFKSLVGVAADDSHSWKTFINDSLIPAQHTGNTNLFVQTSDRIKIAYRRLDDDSPGEVVSNAVTDAPNIKLTPASPEVPHAEAQVPAVTITAPSVPSSQVASTTSSPVASPTASAVVTQPTQYQKVSIATSPATAATATASPAFVAAPAISTGSPMVSITPATPARASSMAGTPGSPGSSAQGTELLSYAFNGDDAALAAALKSQKNLVHYTNSRGATALYVAASQGKASTVIALLSAGASWHKADAAGLNPLHIAAEHGHVDCVTALLGHGAELNKPSADGSTALFRACSSGQQAVVKALLDRGADTTMGVATGATPLMIALSQGHNEIAALLLDAKADATVLDAHQQTPLHFAVLSGAVSAAKTLITAYKLNVNAKTQTGLTPLYLAASKGNAEMVRLLLDNGADRNIASSTNRTPLYAAARAGHVEVVDILTLNDKSAISVKDAVEGNTPLLIASWSGHADVVKLLLQRGSGADEQDPAGLHALHKAALKDHVDVAAVLLKHSQVMAFQRTLNGHQPLSTAATANSCNVLKFLLEKGVDVNARDQWGQTALLRVAHAGHVEAATLLLDFQADSEATDEDNVTPLIAAAAGKHTALLVLLVRRGASVAHSTHGGDCALHFAAKNGDQEAVQVLLASGSSPTTMNLLGQTCVDVAAPTVAALLSS